ncbi:hypothetical protein SI65_07341 [Aspergillus cristatus]|uniref:RNase H type-1 domain-containing protein n=1 Tax=Aspergillus cristatus TaxID=573508 RepID=A0A1E3B7K4_ASPCR|nr:hypothetical protein SI65_07341 [Aspergillus cristatus]
MAIEWGHNNVVQFDAGKTEAVLLIRKRGRELKDQIQQARVEVGGHHVIFNPDATQWLGVWLDSGLNLKTHYQTCMRKARAAEARVQHLCQSHKLAPGLARQVQVATARAITGMLKTTPVGPLVREADLAPAEALLEARQLRYTTRPAQLTGNHPAKKILPFPGRIEALPSPEALAAAQSLPPGLAIWSDGSRLENGRCGAGIAWQEPGGPGQALAAQAHAIAERIQAEGRQPTVQWVPGHAGVEGNERADQAAKQAAHKPPGRGPKQISLAFARRARTEAITAQKQRWLSKELGQRS